MLKRRVGQYIAGRGRYIAVLDMLQPQYSINLQVAWSANWLVQVGAAYCIILSCCMNMRLLEAKEVVVGNEMGWTNYDRQSFKVPNYGSWAAAQKVLVGDQIVFKYVRGMHNINLLPSKTAYASCDFSQAMLLDDGASGVFVWNASTVGEFYFGCNKSVEEEGNDCTGSGQKLALLVTLPSINAINTTNSSHKIAHAPAPAPAAAAPETTNFAPYSTISPTKTLPVVLQSSGVDGSIGVPQRNTIVTRTMLFSFIELLLLLLIT